MRVEPCPVFKKTNLLMSDLDRVLRRLEASAKVCEACFYLPGCSITVVLARAIRKATDEILVDLGGWHG